MKNPPKLRLIATTWTLTAYPSRTNEWSPERKVQAIKAAGFDGIATRLNNPVMKIARRTGLILVGAVDIGSVSEVEKKLRDFKECGITQINVQLCDHDTPVVKSLPIAVRIMQVGDQLGLKPAIEVHRDTCTETPEKTFALADAYQKRAGRKLRMNFDHSHPAIIKHLQPDSYWFRLGVRLDLLRMGDLIHFRPFNGHHCQIPVTNGRGRLTPEFQDWLPFCKKVMGTWLQTARPGREFFVVPELGPKVSGYGLSVFPDIWEDEQRLAHEIRHTWDRLIRKV